MSTAEIHKLLVEKFGDQIAGLNLDAKDPWIEVAPSAIVPVATFLKTDPRLRFDHLNDLCGVDYFEPDSKKQAKFEYEQYFLGHRPREPLMTRGEVQKIIAYWSNLPIRNTKHRFRFNTLCARFFTFRRQWNEINRRIEEGTYEPHNKKARRRIELAEAEPAKQRAPRAAPAAPATATSS